MKDYGDEEVLACSLEKVHDSFAEKFQQYGYSGFFEMPNPTDEIEEIISHSDFILRNKAEQDFSKKQVIPYCLIVYTCAEGDLILHYSRSKTATEQRLAGKRSIGVGGHINSGDLGSSKDFGHKEYMTALHRELKEEFGITEEFIDNAFSIGFVNDEENEVGRVHLGFVHVIVVNSTDLPSLEEHNVHDPTWDFPNQIMDDYEVESWSKMILDGLNVALTHNPWYLSEYQKSKAS